MTAVRIPITYWDHIGGTNNRRNSAKFVRKPRANLEHKFQVRLVKDVEAVSPNALFYAVPNGGLRNVRVAVRLKAEGAKRGVADLCFLLDGGRSAYLELKAPKGRLSKEQIQFRDDVQRLGHYWAAAFDYDTAWGVLAGWGVVPSETEACRLLDSKGAKL